MPLYSWRCEGCGTDLEIVRPIADALIPIMCDCGIPMTQQLSPAYVQADIVPYKAVTGDRAGQYITSRRQHREFLKRNRLIELGDQKPADTSKLRTTPSKREIREELRRAVPEALRNDRRRKNG